jgi:Flp pilus assembly protein TadD
VVGTLVAVALLAAVIGIVAVVRMGNGLRDARQFAKQRRWDDAAAAVSRYLALRPNDAEARLLAAEVVYRAGERGGRRDAAIRESLGHLDRIPDDSPQGPEARLRAAGLLLVFQNRPHAAELQIRRALARDPDRMQAHLQLWQVLDATGRSDFAEPSFREVMRLAPPDQKVFHLRSWYASQFAPLAANLALDRLLGIVATNQVPTADTELARYEAFRAAEPDSPVHAAAAARVLLRKQQAQRAAELLGDSVRRAPPADVFFAATQAEVAHAAGDLTTLAEVMRRWPGPRDGYAYLKWEGVRLEEVADDPAAAAESYRKALEVWPGPVDWQVAFRLSTCLRRLGRNEEANRFKTRSDELGTLIGDDYHRPLRDALADLTDPASAERAADFYRKINRPWEAGLWLNHADSLRRSR